MKTMKCPKCGSVLDITGRVPGSNITCACGNMSVVPKAGMSRGLLFGLIAVSGVVLMCPCIGVMAAIAIPNFIKFQARSKQGECKANLKAWYMMERAYFQEKDTYSLSIQEVGFMPERRNRYAYFAGPGPTDDRSTTGAQLVVGAQGIGVDTLGISTARPITFAQLPEEVGSMVGIQGECPECDITLVCAGQVDTDETLDVWSVSTMERQSEDGMTIPAGIPFNHINDVTD
jgi:type II secretory pathway pseudopilin PulG